MENSPSGKWKKGKLYYLKKNKGYDKKLFQNSLA